MAHSLQWDFAAGWVFAAIHAAGEDADLASVVGAGDAINHAIFTSDELERGVNRLVAAGLLAIDEDKLRVTDLGEQLWDLAGHPRSVHAAIDALVDQLRQSRVPEGVGTWRLAPGELSAAYEIYNRDFWKRYRSM